MIRAVVVEDEPLARQYLCTLLQETGKVEVVGEAADGRAGLRLCVERAPDAAFLDIRIPGPDGLSLAGRLLTLARPPLVVFVTGFSGHAVDAFRVEAVDYLLNPIEFGAVLETVRRLEHRLGAKRDDRTLWVWVVPAATVVSATSVSWAKITLTPYVDLGYRH